MQNAATPVNATYTHPDPEVADALRAAASTESLLGTALSRIGPSHLEAIPEDDDSWSAVETVAHMLDLEVIHGYRMRLLLSDERPRLEAFDEERSIIEQRWRAQDVPVLLTAWGALRRANLALIARLDVHQLGRGGILTAEGHRTARDLVLDIPVHDRMHLSRLGQLEEKLLRPLA